MTAALDERREALLRELWGKGLSASKIAAQVGGFEHCEDGGRNAVIGIVHRRKAAAEKANNTEEVKFWSQRKKKGVSPRKNKSAGSIRKPRNPREKALAEAAARTLVDSVPIKKIEWPTEAEVHAAAAAEISKAARKG